MRALAIVVMALCLQSCSKIKPDICWSDGIKQQVANMVNDQRQEVVKTYAEIIKGTNAADSPVTIDVVAEKFHSTSIDEKSGSATCGCALKLTATVNQVTKQSDDVIAFTIHSSESGPVVSMPSKAVQKLMMSIQ